MKTIVEMNDVPEKIEPTTFSYLRGYWAALNDYGIWKDGSQTIGCLETPIREALFREVKSLGFDDLMVEKVLAVDK